MERVVNSPIRYKCRVPPYSKSCDLVKGFILAQKSRSKARSFSFDAPHYSVKEDVSQCVNYCRRTKKLLNHPISMLQRTVSELGLLQ